MGVLTNSDNAVMDVDCINNRKLMNSALLDAMTMASVLLAIRDGFFESENPMIKYPSMPLSVHPIHSWIILFDKKQSTVMVVNASKLDRNGGTIVLSLK